MKFISAKELGFKPVLVDREYSGYYLKEINADRIINNLNDIFNLINTII